MNIYERIKEYEERYMAWKKATLDHPEIKHGEPPNYKDFTIEQWQATYVQRTVDRELSRTGTISC